MITAAGIRRKGMKILTGSVLPLPLIPGQPQLGRILPNPTGLGEKFSVETRGSVRSVVWDLTP